MLMHDAAHSLHTSSNRSRLNWTLDDRCVVLDDGSDGQAGHGIV